MMSDPGNMRATPRIPLMTGFEQYLHAIRDRIQVENPGLDFKGVFQKVSELWYTMSPYEKTKWEKIAAVAREKYTKDVLEYVNSNNNHERNVLFREAPRPQGSGAQTARDQYAQNYGVQYVQVPLTQGFVAQYATAQDSAALGIKVQEARPQGSRVQTSRAQGSGGQTVARDHYVMDTGTAYKSYLYRGDDPKPEVRRFFIDEARSSRVAPLLAILRELYQLTTQKFSVAWKDEDGDEVLISSDGEVTTMLAECQETVLKLIVRCEKNDTAPKLAEPAASSTSASGRGGIPDALHRNVTCDGCGLAVVGYRYKCIYCDNYDLCAKCEHAGIHSEHCVLRVPIPNMAVPLLQATIKKSRRILKSVASASYEENKKLRRERKSSTEHKTQGKQDSQPRFSRNWGDVFTKYMHEFVNLAGTLSHFPESEATTEPATSTEPQLCRGFTSGLKSVPTDEQISLNPWQLPEGDLVRLKNACRYIRENAVMEATNAFNRAMGGTLAFIKADHPTYAADEGEDSKKGANKPANAENENPEAGPAPRAAVNPEVNPEPQVSPKIYQCVAHPEPASTETTYADCAKMVQDEMMKMATSEQGTLDSASSMDNYVKQSDISELMNAVNKCEMSSNASSCSDGHGSDKAEGWTVIDHENVMKDDNLGVPAHLEKVPEEVMELMLEKARNYHQLNAATANLENVTEEVMEHMLEKARNYPPLNAATAVFNPIEIDVANVPVATKTEPESASKTEQAPKTPAAAASSASSAASAISEDLRMQIAPHVEAAVHQMETMGFSNEGGWLTQLLNHHDGNIAMVLDLIMSNSNGPKPPSN